MFNTGFAIYCLGYTFLILLANEHVHENWCPQFDNSTNTTQPEFFQELCVQYILPVLVFT